MFNKNKILATISRFFLVFYLLFVWIYPVFLLFGVFLIWKGNIVLRIFGWVLILLVAYYQTRWISPWYTVRGSELVQKFSLYDHRFRAMQTPSVRWLGSLKKLLILPSDEIIYNPKTPVFTHLLAIDLVARDTHLQPVSEVNMAATIKLESLQTCCITPTKEILRIECSNIGFSLPILGYYFGFPCGGSYGWEWAKRFFTWKRKVVRSASGSVLVELNKIIFNDDELRYYSGGASAWVMEGKFFVFEDELKIFVLGPFATTSTQ